MSISASAAAGFSNSWRSSATTSSPANSDFTPASASGASASTASAFPAFSPVDGIQVNLPNGLSVGVFQISQAPGGTQGSTTPASSDSDSFAQMLQSVEQLVADFANAPGAASNGAASANSASLASAANLAPGQTMNGIDVSLPNGYSAEIFGVSQAGGAPASAGSESSDDQMVSTMEQLVANLSGYPATAASAYGKTATDPSSGTGNVNSVA